MITYNFDLVLCDHFPSDPQDGNFYYSEEFRSSLHLCACGCKGRVVMPIKAAGWTLTRLASSFSISPSVGNRELVCRSHYFIRNGKVIWLKSMSNFEKVESRLDDRSHMRSVYNKQTWKSRFLSLFRR